MRRLRCTHCGNTIMKSAFYDPYLCRDCEQEMRDGGALEKYAYLDSG